MTFEAQDTEHFSDSAFKAGGNRNKERKLSVNNQGIHKIRGIVMSRVHQTLSKHWPEWWRALGGLNGAEMRSAGTAMHLMDTAPSDLALGYAFGLYTVRTNFNLLSTDDLVDSNVALQVMRAVDHHNNELATKHMAFADMNVPEFGPDFSDFEVWFHQAPNDFACGTVCGHFSAFDEIARSGKNVVPVVQPLTPRR
ncbi:hypothetical protein [Achromobacter sp.]|uniref:hypothetical protein n=1 Tax=Achromobacter sp. TaxID=134375 RepID=UPI00257EDBB7|nr:hypothetical protein [Achromobacter sp.]